MKRTNIYDRNYNFIGWFDQDAAKVLATHKEGNPYVSYRWIYLTAGGKLVLEESANTHSYVNYYTISGDEAVELINSSGTEDGLKWAEGKGKEFFNAAEIK